MIFTQHDAPLPDLARWRRLRGFGRDTSILRQLQYEKLTGLALDGPLLDFGGGRRTGYAALIPDGIERFSVNIDGAYDPTDIVKPGDPLPYPDDRFACVLTLNTLEHVYDDAAALAELHRVLRPGGRLHVMVPFIYRVHGHPEDYHRHPPWWWRETLGRIGFATAWLQPLVFGRATTARLIGGRGDRVIRPLGDSLAAWRDIATARIRFRGRSGYAGRRAARVWENAPGWYIGAQKKGEDTP